MIDQSRAIENRRFIRRLKHLPAPVICQFRAPCFLFAPPPQYRFHASVRDERAPPVPLQRQDRGRKYTAPELEFFDCPDCGEKVYSREIIREIESCYERPKARRKTA